MIGNETDQLAQEGYIIVPYPQAVKDTIAEAIELWHDFCEAPQERKEWYKIGDEDLSDLGYSRRDGTGPKGDRKEFFHIWKAGIPRFDVIPAQHRGENDSLFFQLIEELTAGIAPLVAEVTNNIETQQRVNGLSREIVDNFDKCTFRFIHYFPSDTKRAEIAHAHADKSALTLHLHESCTGLERFWNDRWESMPVSETQTVIIPGLALQYRASCKLIATCHRVVATSESATRGRYSLVCFIPLMKTPAYDVKNAPRLQETAPGFNYQMPFEEFRTLFRER